MSKINMMNLNPNFLCKIMITKNKFLFNRIISISAILFLNIFHLAAQDIEVDSTLTKTSSDSISQFNGIDYYSGRMIKGFGFRFNQYIEEQIDGRQEFESTPSMYYNINNKVSFELMNRTSIKKIKSDETFNFQTDPVNNRIQLRAQVRPIKGIQLFPYFEINNRTHLYNLFFEDDIHAKDEADIHKYGFEGMYISKKGMINPDDQKLKWMYFLDETIPFIDKGQTLITFSGNVEYDRYRGYTDNIHLQSMKREHKTVWDDFKASGKLVYGIADNLVGCVHSHFYSFKSDLWNTSQGNESIADQKIQEYSIKFNLNNIVTKEIFNRITFGYTKLKEESNYHTINFQKRNIKDAPAYHFQYGFHWLSGSKDIELGKVLANYHHFFGNRLERGAFHAWCNLFYDSEILNNKYQHIFETYPLYLMFNPDLRSQISRFELTASYGLSDFIEIGIMSQIKRNRTYKPNPITFKNTWFERTSLENSFVIDFSNYIYSEGLKGKYGWSTLSSFNQYYGPILDHFMFKGKIEFSYFSYDNADDYFCDVDAYNPFLEYDNIYVSNKKWRLNTHFKCGLWNNLELQYSGRFNFYSTKLRNYHDKDFDINFTLVWQPWKSLRFEIYQNSSKYTNNWDTRFSYLYIDPSLYFIDIDQRIYNRIINSWKLRIISLF
jgi:hypothetical protein